MFKILIDGDGCPVVDETLDLAQYFNVPVILVADTSHDFQDSYATIYIADKGKDQSDFLLLKHVEANDLIITQDYGLASLVLAKGGRALSQNGFFYTKENIDGLLASRHDHAKLRKHKHYGHTPKRTKQDDENFCEALEAVLKEVVNNEKFI